MPATNRTAPARAPFVRTAIGPNDIITVRGQYLYQSDGSRFFMKGLAFPVSVEERYNATAWIGILQQLHSYDLQYNTIRVYRMDPAVDYTEFFEAAASLGIYVIVPLTSKAGDGVLNRDIPAPKCYDQALYEYGVACLENYGRYPNILAGLLANEVLNSVESWQSAPCIKAYGRDLKLYAKLHNYRPLPLIYAAQHSGLGVDVGSVATMWLTLNYLTCATAGGRSGALEVSTEAAAIDIFGVNMESWCSSQASFVFDEDGTTAGPYYSLWLGLHDSSVPMVFTEMGCSHLQFDRDNGLRTPEGTRDWKQVEVVLHDMSDTWSGFCAYAYNGNPTFTMFRGGPWHADPLEPTKDFWNFRDALTQEASNHSEIRKEPPVDFDRILAPTCQEVEDALTSCCDIQIIPSTQMPSFAIPGVLGTNLQIVRTGFSPLVLFCLAGISALLLTLKQFAGHTSTNNYQPVGENH